MCFDERILKILKARKGLKAVLMFGSYLKNSEKARDVDIAFVGDISEETALDLFGVVQSAFNKELDWVVLNRKTNDILAFEIMKNHKKLYVKDKEYLADLFSLVLRKHEDAAIFRSRNK